MEVTRENSMFSFFRNNRSKPEIRIFKHREETDVSKILWKFLGDDFSLESVVCNVCLTKTRIFNQFQSQIKDAVHINKVKHTDEKEHSSTHTDDWEEGISVVMFVCLHNFFTLYTF